MSGIAVATARRTTNAIEQQSIVAIVAAALGVDTLGTLRPRS